MAGCRDVTAGLGATVRKFREAAGLTQSELAGRVGMTKEAVGMVECGRRDPSLRTVRLLAEVFCCTPGFLIDYGAEDDH